MSKVSPFRYGLATNDKHLLLYSITMLLIGGLVTLFLVFILVKALVVVPQL